MYRVSPYRYDRNRDRKQYACKLKHIRSQFIKMGSIVLCVEHDDGGNASRRRHIYDEEAVKEKRFIIHSRANE